MAPRLAGRDFLDMADFSADEVRSVIDLAARIKAGDYQARPLSGRSIAILFQKPSMRTRVSFELAVTRLGGHPVVLQDSEIGLGSRETPEDIGHILERYCDGIVARVFRHDHLVRVAAAASVPVVNALTDRSHPCQALADLLTLQERFGNLADRRLAFVGDGNNVASSLIESAALLGFQLTLVTPPRYAPVAAVIERARALTGGPFRVRVTGDLAAIGGSEAVYTDVWTSMGQEAETEARRRAFAEYQVNPALMELAPGAVFMHCLPAHRGEEVTGEVIDGPASIVFDQAENRLWAQMALLALVCGESE